MSPFLRYNSYRKITRIPCSLDAGRKGIREMALRWDKKRKRYIIDLRDNTGKRRWKTLPAGIKKKDATVEHAEVLKKIKQNTYCSAREIPRFKELALDWLNFKKADVRKGTLEQYTGHIHNHLLPFFGNLKVDAITYPAVLKFMNNSKASPATVRKILTTLNSIMTHCIRCGYIDRNPVQYVERPKRNNGEREQISVFKSGEIQALLEAGKDMKFRVLLLFSVLTGVRQGEALAVRWGDIDWQRSQVDIRRTFNRGEFYAPKSETSIRSVDLGPTLVQELKEWRLLSPHSRDEDLIFASSVGTPMNRGNLLRRLYVPALKAAKVPYRKWHTLRHTFASTLIEAGESVVYVAAQLGHSSPGLTLRLYSHLVNDTNSQAAKKLERAMLGE